VKRPKGCILTRAEWNRLEDDLRKEIGPVDLNPGHFDGALKGAPVIEGFRKILRVVAKAAYYAGLAEGRLKP
jgi:hypothetical protein